MSTISHHKKQAWRWARVLRAALAGCVALAFVGARARAAEPVTVLGYAVSITVQGATASAYQGSKHYAPFPSVAVAFVRPEDYDLFGAPDDSPSATIVKFGNVSMGPAANFIPDRGDSHALAGMRKIGWAGEGGGFVNWWVTPSFRVRAEALKGLFSEDGLLVNTAADFVTQKGRFTLSAGPRLALADGNYNSTYFGVTAAEALTSKHYHAAYRPNAGPLSAGLATSLEYRWRDRWRLDLSANYDRLLADAANSPIVRVTGSANQYSVAGGVRFMLGR